MKIGQIIEWRRLNGPTVQAHGYVVTLESQALSIRFPFGGLVWNRPSHVFVETESGTQRVLIVDVTRVIQLVLLGVGFMIYAVAWLRGRG